MTKFTKLMGATAAVLTMGTAAFADGRARELVVAGRVVVQVVEFMQEEGDKLMEWP